MQLQQPNPTSRTLYTPLSDTNLRTLRAGDMILLTGTIYTARDAAHARLVAMARQGEAIPFPFVGETVFYAGPAPAKPGKPIGSVGPTTGGRMDAYSPTLIQMGLKIMIGKGGRSKEVIDAIRQHGGIYFAAIGGVAALMDRCVKSVRMVAFEELGTEAIRALEVRDLPLIVAIDTEGNDIYSTGPQAYKTE